MSLRPVIAALALAAIAAVPAPASAADANRAVKPLRPVSSCLDVTRINEWYAPDDRTLIVRAGPHRFRVDLKAACPQLDRGAGAHFVTSHSPALAGRICGDIGEKVINVSGLACGIRSVRPIDKATFKALESKALKPREAPISR